MELRMNDFNISYLKIRFLGGYMKNQYFGGEMPEMGGLDS